MTDTQTLARKTQRIGQFVMLGTTILFFAGCAVGPKYKAPAVPAPPAYKEVGDWKTAQPSLHAISATCACYATTMRCA